MSHHPDSFAPGYMRLYAVRVQNRVTVLYDGRTGERIGCIGPEAVAAQVVGDAVHITTPEGEVQEWSARVGCFRHIVSRPAPQAGSDPNASSDDSDALGCIVFLGLGALYLVGLYVVPLPGIFCDWVLGRFTGDKDGLWLAAHSDVLTWEVSVVFWLALAVSIVGWRWARKVRVQAQPVRASETGTSTGSHATSHTQQTPNSGSVGQDQPRARTSASTGSSHNSPYTDAEAAEVLGLGGSVTMVDVRAAYRSKISEYHPDKVAHLGPKLRELAEAESKRLNAAYQHFETKYGCS